MRKVGWALAHRDNRLEQSPTIQRHVDQTKRRRRRVRPGRLPGSNLAAFAIFLLAMFLVFIFVLWPICGRLIGKFIHEPGIDIRQKAQLISIDAAIELLRTDIDIYPPSDALDENGKSYCGAMKLCEAMMGQDLHGFNPSSKFRADGLDESGSSLYDSNTLEVRKGPYLPEENGNPCRLKDLFENIGPFDGNEYVLCDTYRVTKKISNGMYIGMPVLYYKADTSKTAHDINDPNNPENIYDYRDNQALLALGVPGKPGQKHPLYENPKIFYEMTRNTRIAGPSVPNRAETYILLSAGRDGLYGTKDDIANFEMQWRPK